MFYLFDVTRTNKNYGTLQQPPPHNDNNKHPLDDDDDDESQQLLFGLHHNHHPNDEEYYLLNIDEALQRLGMGLFQYRMMFATGLFLAADSCEVVVLSFLSHVARSNHWYVDNGVEFNDYDYGNNNKGFSEGDAYDTDTTDGGDTLSTIVLPGALIGALLWGMVSDLYGRRIIFLIIASVVSIFGIATSFVTTYKWLLVARILVSFGIGGLTVPFNACAELLPPSTRGKQLTLMQIGWIVGALAVHVVLQQQEQEAIADSEARSRWRWVAGFCAIPSILATILAWMFVPESPRWLLARGENEIALDILRHGAKINGKDPYETFPRGVMLYSHETEEVTSTPHQIFQLFSSGWMKITAALFSTYFGKAFLDHGTVSMAVTVFSRDERQQDYQAWFSASSEFLGLIVVYFVIDRWGRAATQCIAYALAGVICLTLALLVDFDPDLSPNLLLVLAFMSHLVVNTATTATWISTTEVLATAIRTTGHGTAHAIARIGGALSTYVLARTYSIPTVGLILFVTSVWTASASSKLPDTNLKEMGVVHYPTRRRRRDSGGNSSSSNNNNRKNGRRKCCRVSNSSNYDDDTII